MGFDELLTRAIEETKPVVLSSAHSVSASAVSTSSRTSKQVIERLEKKHHALRRDHQFLKQEHVSATYERDSLAHQLWREKESTVQLRRDYAKYRAAAESAMKAEKSLLQQNAVLRQKNADDLRFAKKLSGVKDALLHHVVYARELNLPVDPSELGSAEEASSPRVPADVFAHVREKMDECSTAFLHVSRSVPCVLQAELEKEAMHKELEKVHEKVDVLEGKVRVHKSAWEKAERACKHAQNSAASLREVQRRCEAGLEQSAEIVRSAAESMASKDKAVAQTTAELSAVREASQARALRDQRTILEAQRQQKRTAKDLEEEKRVTERMESEASVINDWRIRSTVAFKQKYGWQGDEIAKLRKTLARGRSAGSLRSPRRGPSRAASGIGPPASTPLSRTHPTHLESLTELSMFQSA